MDDIFSIWDKIQKINIDFIIFVFVVIFVLKFKDLFELLFKYSTHRTEQLNLAKKLLEESGYADSKEMVMIKRMMKYRAVKIATNLINDKYGNLYCYLFSKCTEEEMHGLHKTVPFVEGNGNEFHLNDRALTKRRSTGILLSVALVFLTIYMSIIFKTSPSINLNWLFSSFIILEVGFFFYWWAKIMPDDIEVKYTKQLLKKTNIDEFNEYLKAPDDTTTHGDIG
ncbi:hypothetical protein [Pantoea phytobeneficialis]|nr:hypothetical protein [Pantoea phytobeneficialis]MDO6407225.1 hypothetical protein [Pantoea phytobeneficialis]